MDSHQSGKGVQGDRLWDKGEFSAGFAVHSQWSAQPGLQGVLDFTKCTFKGCWQVPNQEDEK